MRSVELFRFASDGRALSMRGDIWVKCQVCDFSFSRLADEDFPLFLALRGPITRRLALSFVSFRFVRACELAHTVLMCVDIVIITYTPT